jgi:hypothetical protein
MSSVDDLFDLRDDVDRLPSRLAEREVRWGLGRQMSGPVERDEESS